MSFARFTRIIIAIIVIMIGALVGILDDSLSATPIDLVNLEYTKGSITTGIYKYINSGYKGKYKLIPSTSEGCDLKFSTGDETEEGYTTNSVGKSRMVVAFPFDMVYSDRDANFHKFDNGSHGYYTTDIYKLLNQFIETKSGTINTKDTGFDTRVKKLTLAIPDNGYLYRRDVVDSYIYIMANGEEITAENAEDILKKVKEMFSYATVLSNYGALLDDKDYIGIVPEFMYKEIKGTNTWYPVYYNNCNYIDFKMYTSENLDSNAVAEIMESFNNDKNMYRDTGFYGKCEQSMGNAQVHAATNIELVDKQDDFEELFGSNYWKHI